MRYELIRARVQMPCVDEQDDGLFMESVDGYQCKWIPRGHFSYASWFMACRAPIRTPLELLILTRPF